MSIYDSKVIGYIASTSRTNVVCVEKDACLVAGSEEAMNRYLSEINLSDKTTVSIRKARFGDIVNVMKLGGKYSFDKESYSRFYPLGIKIGMLLEDADFDEGKGRKFFTAKIHSKSL
jgi:hypothetical protein